MADTRRTRDDSTPLIGVSEVPPDLRRHLRALGLADVVAYRRWCRRHGFRDTLNKPWQERRAERQAADAETASLAAQAEQDKHWAALGLASAAEYTVWCRAHGLSTAVGKTGAQRRRELTLADGERAAAALAEARPHHHRPEDIVHAVHDGTVPSGTLKAPHLRKIEALFSTLGPPDIRHAFLRLLLHVLRHARLFGMEPAYPHLGPQSGNTFLDGLAALSQHQADWRRAPEEWRPDSHNAHRQFGALARHLLAPYAVPAFLDAAWCEGDGAEAVTHRAWFLHIGGGKNIRTAPGLPLALSRRAAHLFVSAPADLPIPAALRWAQVKALGADERLVRAVLGTRLGENFEHDAFWVSVLHFFRNHPMLDPAWVGPMVDFISHIKFTPQNGDGLPSEPEFSMRGRSPAALQRRVETWHQELAQEARKAPLEWPPCGLHGFRSEPTPDPFDNAWVWTVEEIRSAHDLSAEGKAMHHCVASYAHSCARGQKSIWSLGVEDVGTGTRRRVMTVEVHNARRQIVQARGRCNKTADDRRAGERLVRGKQWLSAWARQEGLTIASHV